MIYSRLKSARKLVVCAIVISGTLVKANSIAPIRVKDLYSRSSEIVRARVVSGNTEAYQYSASDPTPWPVCKLKVMDSFKHALTDDIIFLAPCADIELGGEYILFLENANPPSLRPGFERNSYGVLERSKKISNAGNGSMHVEYTCVFDGRVPDQSCDYGVELNPSQVILPKSLATFPKAPATEETNYKRWIRKKEFVELLRSFAQENDKGS